MLTFSDVSPSFLLAMLYIISAILYQSSCPPNIPLSITFILNLLFTFESFSFHHFILLTSFGAFLHFFLMTLTLSLLLFLISNCDVMFLFLIISHKFFFFSMSISTLLLLYKHIMRCCFYVITTDFDSE